MKNTLLLLSLSALAVGACSKKKPADAPAPAPAAAQAPVPNADGDIPAPPDVREAPADAIRSTTGLVTKVIQPGTGTEHPGAIDKVTVHYTGWTTDGRMFDSSVKRGQPATFPLNRVIPGWTEAVQLMVKGEKRRAWIPEELAYKGRPGAPAGMLVFDVELIDITHGPKPLPVPPVPDDVKAAPKGAAKTASGVASKVLEKGSGTVHPTAEDTVEVHYAGWTTDGKMFDNSYDRGETIKFPLNGVIKGWTDGVQLMVEGEKRRLWIPEELAYKGINGAPQGTLVFDIELVKIVKR